MSGSSSGSRERIIPIQIEKDDNREAEEEMDTSFEESQSSGNNSNSKDALELFEIENELTHAVDLKERCLPVCNAKEKIIIVFDSAEDENLTPFKLNNNMSRRPTVILKQALELFLHSMHLINKNHEYALVILNENSAAWRLNFTTNLNQVIHALEEVECCDTEDIFDLNTIFNVIKEKVTIPTEDILENQLLPPPYVVRIILLYGRSYTMPKLKTNKEIEALLSSPFFTVDVLMTHEPPGNDNNCQKIFDVLQNIDKKGFAYFFSVERDTKTLYTSIGKLLSHPLQRPIQKLANYSFINRT